MPRRVSQPLWFGAQAAAIATLTWAMTGRGEPVPPPLTPAIAFVGFAMAVIAVAFGTAVITNLWDWSHRQLQRLRGPGLPAMRPDDRKAIEQRDGGSAWLRRCQLGKPPTALR